MVIAEESGFHHSLFSQHDQIPPVTSFPADDAGSSHARPCFVRVRQKYSRAAAQSARDLRARAALFLLTAMVHGAPSGHRVRLACRTAGGVAVGVAGLEVLASTAFRNRLSTLGGLSCLDYGRAVALSLVQMVCGRESAPSRLVAVVFVTFFFEFRIGDRKSTRLNS